MQTQNNFLTVKQLAERYPAFTVSAIRSLIFYASERKSSQGVIPGNGLAPAIIRIGRKVIINENRFIEWVSAQNTQDYNNEQK